MTKKDASDEFVDMIMEKLSQCSPEEQERRVAAAHSVIESRKVLLRSRRIEAEEG